MIVSEISSPSLNSLPSWNNLECNWAKKGWRGQAPVNLRRVLQEKLRKVHNNQIKKVSDSHREKNAIAKLTLISSLRT